MVPVEVFRFLDPEFTAVADIGAATGNDCIAYAAIFEHAHVYGFEPVKTNIDFARQVCSEIPDLADRIHLHHTALGSEDGWAEIYRSTGKPYANAANDVVDEHGDWRLSSSLLRPKDHLVVHPWCGFRAESVFVTRLDTWARTANVKRFDFLHIDVQGAELDVLRGAGKLLESVKGIWLEVSMRELYEGQPLVGDVEKFMHAAGFRLVLDRPAATAQGDQLWIR